MMQVSVDRADRVARAKQLLAAGANYPQGCSDFVASVLQIPWENANSLMGGNPTYVGVNNTYSGLSPGDIAGWIDQGASGHVAVYVGEPQMKFIDVRDVGGTPRAVVNGYGSQPVYKSSRF
jgi:hypothetical protein